MERLSAVCAALDWPEAKAILDPEGPGAAVQVRLAKERIEAELRRKAGASGVKVGLLLQDPDASDTTSPFAILCEFPRPMDDATVAEAHRLAWNFCRAPLLITIDPTTIRVWSCMRQPEWDRTAKRLVVEQAELTHLRSTGVDTISHAAKRALSWIELVSGQFFRENNSYFPSKGRADQQLLAAMKGVRKLLKEANLNDDIAHDLIARLVFIQFLWDRKDSDGQAALTEAKLEQLHKDGYLSKAYHSIADVLRNYKDTYNLFRYLNDRFNGDLFPGKAATEEEREQEWAAEQEHVKPAHLDILAGFIAGEVEFVTRQYSAWRLYAFDTIPLEFISSVYEEFVHKKGEATGAHYTPLHLVDFVLDGVLPWHDPNWDVRILDPACGSGIFLVKSFQRLVHRWRIAHPAEDPAAAVLVSLLENNLVGVDMDPHATRVASFSLYLALCDALDPRSYWSKIRFPIMREKRIIREDFFREDRPLFRSTADAGTFDLVVGNAPWGKNSITEEAEEWAAKQVPNIPISNGDIGPLFLSKGLKLVKEGGLVAMVQPASTLLLARWDKAIAFRKMLFSTTRVEEIVNFSSHRFKLFPNATSAACSITLRSAPRTDAPVRYICPKLLHTPEDEYRIRIDPMDVNAVQIHAAAHDPYIWTTLMLGGNRELELVRRLVMQFPSIAKRKVSTASKLKDRSLRILTQEGIQIYDGPNPDAVFRDCRALVAEAFPAGTELTLDEGILPVVHELPARWNTDAEIFKPPQLLFKQTFTQERGRFHAVKVVGGNEEGVVCTQSYISMRVAPADEHMLDSICIAGNSQVATFFFAVTSSRMGYIPELLAKELYALPFPLVEGFDVGSITSLDQLDELAFERYGLSPVERMLIEDTVKYGLPEVLRKGDTPGRQPTPRDGAMQEVFARTAMQVFHATFGAKFPVCATVFNEQDGERAWSMRIIALHLNCPVKEHLKVHTEFLPRTELGERVRSKNRHGQSAVIYDRHVIDDKEYPTVYILKPDQQRFWCRSVALRDADSLVAGGLVAPDPSPLQNRAPISLHG